MITSFTNKHFNALRSIALTRSGLRKNAYPTVMPGLINAGLVEERQKHQRVKPDETAFYLTAADRRLLAKVGMGEPD